MISHAYFKISAEKHIDINLDGYTGDKEQYNFTVNHVHSPNFEICCMIVT